MTMKIIYPNLSFINILEQAFIHATLAISSRISYWIQTQTNKLQFPITV